MPTVRWVERQIERVEGFRVAFHHPDGRDVRGDMEDVLPYPYARALAGDRTVREWIDLRFKQPYRGFDVVVFHVSGEPAHGRTLLSTLRAET